MRLTSLPTRARLATGVMLWALVLPVLAGAAAAQTAPAKAGDQGADAQASTPAAQPQPVGTTAEQQVGDIVVTGSRVSNGNNSPTPLTVVSAQELLSTQPGSIAAGLSTLPGMMASLGTTSNTNTGGFGTINLRGIGPLRALVLFDGYRVGPTQANIGPSTNGAVNIDVIPQMLLKRVDVVTGGASAVYGSDAVSGVVNFVTDTKFEGLRLLAQNGISRYGDDRKTDLGVAWGHAFGDRAHLVLSYEFRDAAGFLRSQRPFFDTIYTEQGAVPNAGSPGTTANPYILTAGGVLSTASFGGRINSGPLVGLNFTQNGLLTPFVNGAATGTTGVQIGGDGAYFTRATAAPSQRIHRVFGRFDYDLADELHFHAQLAYANLTQSYTGQNLLLSNVAIGYNNAFLATLQPQYQSIVAQQLANAPAGTNPSFQLSKMVTAAPNYRFVAKPEYWMAAAGLNGKLGDFSWSTDYYHTNSALKLTVNNNVDASRLAAALNAVVNPANGQIVCNAALVNPAYAGCVPLNVFGPTAESQAAANYISQSTSSTAFYTQDDISATLSGNLLSLPAGPLAVALNGEWRKLTYRVSSDATPTDTNNCVGVQFNCTATTSPYVGGAVAVQSLVSQTVFEGAVEADVPIFADRAFAKAFNINAAARYTNYDTSGVVWTWKVGGTWSINDAVKLRATRSRDIRAPNLTDLFAAPSTRLTNYLDLHTGQSGLTNRIAQGNPTLTPEKANTITAGIVLTPGFLPRFSLAVDYYDIRIDDAIVTIDPLTPATQVACEQSNGTAAVCSLYIRPSSFSDRSAANYPTALQTTSLNVASISTRGVDVEANYATRVAGRPLGLRALVTWQPHLVFDNGPSGIVYVAGAADGLPGSLPIARLKFLASANYDIDDHLSVRVQERWRQSLTQNGSRTLVYADPKIPAIGYTDVNLKWDVNRNFNLGLNVQNLFDAKPPPAGLVGGALQPSYIGGYAQGDDIEGRYFTVSARVNF